MRHLKQLPLLPLQIAMSLLANGTECIQQLTTTLHQIERLTLYHSKMLMTLVVMSGVFKKKEYANYLEDSDHLMQFSQVQIDAKVLVVKKIGNQQTLSTGAMYMTGYE